MLLGDGGGLIDNLCCWVRWEGMGGMVSEWGGLDGVGGMLSEWGGRMRAGGWNGLGLSLYLTPPEQKWTKRNKKSHTK